MQFDIYNPYPNQAVTMDYIKIIEESLQRAGHTTHVAASIEKLKENRQKGIVCVGSSSVRKAARCSYGTIIRWVQGVGEAESFMRNHSWLRFWVLSALNWCSFRKSDYLLFCSETMKHHYEKKFRMKFASSYIMPCFNDEMNKSAFLTKNKYDDNIFVYAGSMAVWQCFEPTVALYREVEKQVDNCSFRVLTGQKEEAEQILKKYGVERYSIDFVPKEQVAAELAKAKFGFCLREDNIVNRVATPTKLSGYIANGVIPVCSEYVEDFHARATNCKYCVCANPGDLEKPVAELVVLCKETICPDRVYEEYEKVFGEYYSKQLHVEKLSAGLKEFFDDKERSCHSKKNNP